MKFETKVHKIVIDNHIKFLEDPSFCWGDIRKTISVFFNHWFSMYFSYFPNFAPPKSSDMDNYWILMNFFWNYLSKCTYLMNKMTPVSVYMLFSSLSNKQILFDSFQETPCMNPQHLSVLVFVRVSVKGRTHNVDHKRTYILCFDIHTSIEKKTYWRSLLPEKWRKVKCLAKAVT